LYDYVEVDSDVEREFAADCEKRDDIKFYFKLPGWFFIDTPIGKYQPDWALVYENDKRIYFVAETKGTSDINDASLAPGERQRIRCGKRHFAEFEGVIFRAPVKSLSELRG
jgi:type III restriction enzyme